MAPLLKKGKVTIDFAITKNGQVAGMRYVFGSGDVALDRAAYGGITASNPFPPLPAQFAYKSPTRTSRPFPSSHSNLRNSGERSSRLTTITCTL